MTIIIFQQVAQVLEAKLETIRKQLLAGGDPAQLRPQFSEIEAQITQIKEQTKEFNPESALTNLLKTCASIESIWEELFPVERYRLAHLLFDRIQIFTDHLVMDVKTDGLKSLIKELGADESGKVVSIAELTKQLDVDKNYIVRDLRLLSLAPDIQKQIAEGREPGTLSLIKLREPFPDDWAEHRKRFLGM